MSTQSNTIGPRRAGQLVGSSLRYGRTVYHCHAYVNTKNLEKNILRNIDVRPKKGKNKTKRFMLCMSRCLVFAQIEEYVYSTCSLQLIHTS